MFTRLLNKTCVVQQKSLTQNGIGETSETWADINEYKTRYEKSNKSRVIDENYKISLDEYLFFFDKDAVLGRDDRIIVDSKIFNVLSFEIISGFSGDHHVEVYAIYYDHE